jgi:hypothetical protein
MSLTPATIFSALLLLLTLAALPARAQEEPDPSDGARFHSGPLAWTPTLRLKSLGIDTNVFNEIDNPKRDLVMVAGPSVDAWLRLGRARITTTGGADYSYFNHYSSERSLNTNVQSAIACPLRWITPKVTASLVRTRERQNYEIDARVRRRETSIGAAADVRISPRTRASLALRQSRVGFDGAALFQGIYLSETLNRTTDDTVGQLAYKVTPLTTLVVAADRQREHFEFLPIRDAESHRVTAGLELDAFMTGKAHFGYRRLDFFDSKIPDFTGLVADVDLGYSMRGLMRINLRAERDVGYSFEINQSYYLASGFTFSITQSLGGPRDVQARLGRQWLEYRGVVPEAGHGLRVDEVFSGGAEFGYRLGQAMRVALSVDYTRRSSPASFRDYRGVHAGTSLTYAY